MAGAPTMMNNDNCAYFTLEIEAISTFRSVIKYEVSDFRNVLSPGGHKPGGTCIMGTEAS